MFLGEAEHPLAFETRARLRRKFIQAVLQVGQNHEDSGETGFAASLYESALDTDSAGRAPGGARPVILEFRAGYCPCQRCQRRSRCDSRKDDSPLGLEPGKSRRFCPAVLLEHMLILEAGQLPACSRVVPAYLGGSRGTAASLACCAAATMPGQLEDNHAAVNTR